MKSEKDRREQIDALLVQDSPHVGFYDIMKLLAEWDDGPERDEAVEFIEGQLARLHEAAPTRCTDEHRAYSEFKVFWPDFPEGEPQAPFRLLRRLEPLCTGYVKPMLQQLADSPHMSGITMLRLFPPGGAAYRDLPEKPVVGDEGAQILAHSPHLSQLRSLDLFHQDIGDKGARALAASPHLQQLTSLNLSSNTIGTDGARALASGSLSRLRDLHLGGNPIGGEGIAAFCSSTTFPRLNCFNVAGVGLDEEGAAQIVETAAPIRARELVLSSEDFGDAMLVALVSSEALAEVEVLRLSSPQLTLEGMEALAHSPHLGCLRELSLGGVALSPPSLRALAQSPLMKQLTSLYLRGCRMGDEGFAALLELPDDHCLRSLDVGYNFLTERSMELLLHSSLPGVLEEFEMENIQNTDACASLVASTPAAGLLPSDGLRRALRSISSEAKRGLAEASHLDVDTRASFHSAISKKELLPRAKALGLKGLSKMPKEELFRAVLRGEEAAAEEGDG